jgi:hypothetical protein
MYADRWLVVLDGPSNHFVSSGRAAFTAPAGTSVVGLDGHTVQVEVSSGGYATSIAEVHVPDRSGHARLVDGARSIVATDATGRRFSFAGDTRRTSRRRRSPTSRPMPARWSKSSSTRPAR